jgi:potassium efflux system protein
MNWTRLTIASILFAFLNAPLALAQSSQGENDQVSLSEIRQFRAQTEIASSLADDLRARILELCDAAEMSLQKAADNREAAAGFERGREDIDRLVANLRSQLEQPERQAALPLAADPTIAQAEDALARERARLSANRSALRNQQRVAEDRATSRNEISQRLGELDLEIELLNDELRQQPASKARTELKVARQMSLLARREAATAETEMLRSRLALINDQSSLIPLETDLVQRRVDFSLDLVTLLEDAAHDLRVAMAHRELGRIREKSRQLSESLPLMAPIAVETEKLAEILWAPDGVVASSERTIRGIDDTRQHQAQLNRITNLARRKFQAYGHRGSLTRWWPDIPEDFPEPGTIADIIQDLNREIPEVEHQLIVFEQQRSRAHELTRDTILAIQDELGEGVSPELTQQVRGLLNTRQDLLDELIGRGGRYSNQLVEYRTALEKFLGQVREVERFLFSHVLWSRSVPRPIIPRLRDIGGSLAWLTSIDQLKSLSIIGFEFRGNSLFAALVLILIVLLRQPIRGRLHTISDRVADPESDTVGVSIRALILTLLLAAPLPMALLIVGGYLDRIGGSTYWHASAEAFSQLAMVAAIFELVRQLFGPDGLAEAHFAWPVHATRPLYRGLLITEVIGLPLLYIALHLAFAGMRLDSPDDLQIYNNSLGRVAFIAALTIFGLSILGMLRPEKRPEPLDQEMRVPWPRRFSEYAFPTAFLGAYPIILLATAVPAVLAVLGFYVTGMLFAYQMLRTLLLALVVMVGGGVIYRWRIINRNRSFRDAPDDIDEAQQLADFEAADSQIRQLHRFGVTAALIIGLFVIWSDALPMLQVLKRVQIIPSVQMLEASEGTTITVAATGDPAEAPEESTAAPEGTSVPGAPPMPGDKAAASKQPAPSTPLTLWNLLEAILAALFTVVLVRNLPSVIEITLKRRTTLDIGARVAISTLIRYSITIVGMIVVFRFLGVTWDKVQWLAAALTFGLAFGLQEIVANFVSGLILLVERPVRVGDVVTIGNLTGRVTRIRIRATTITLWDRSEMVVPNKEFITTKLVNWTLSDSSRRIEVPLRIAYGANLDLVKDVLVDVAERNPSVLDDPAPHVLVLSFGNDAINVELRFVVDFGQGLKTKDEVQVAIDKAFRENGIQFALPKSEVRFVSESGDAPDKVDPATT